MRKRLLFLIALAIPTAAHAWTPETDLRIAAKASQLAPPDLKFLIDKFEDEFRQGVTLASQEDLRKPHRDFGVAGRRPLRESLEAEIDAAIEMMRKRDSISRFVERLGVISHLVADANNPLHVANSDARLEASHQDFERYVQRRLSVIPTVFYGLEIDRELGTYLDGVFERSSSLYPLLSEEYFRHGARRTSEEFDDRSTAFGVASLSYSHSVTDLVNIYYYIWKEAGGDVRAGRALKRGNLLLNPETR